MAQCWEYLLLLQRALVRSQQAQSNFLMFGTLNPGHPYLVHTHKCKYSYIWNKNKLKNHLLSYLLSLPMSLFLKSRIWMNQWQCGWLENNIHLIPSDQKTKSNDNKSPVTKRRWDLHTATEFTFIQLFQWMFYAALNLPRVKKNCSLSR